VIQQERVEIWSKVCIAGVPDEAERGGALASRVGRGDELHAGCSGGVI